MSSAKIFLVMIFLSLSSMVVALDRVQELETENAKLADHLVSAQRLVNLLDAEVAQLNTSLVNWTGKRTRTYRELEQKLIVTTEMLQKLKTNIEKCQNRNINVVEKVGRFKLEKAAVTDQTTLAE